MKRLTINAKAKNLILIILLVIFVCSLGAFLSSCACEKNKDEGIILLYTPINDGKEYSVKSRYRYRAKMSEISIPSTYNGKPVTTIEKLGFEYLWGLKKINIPDSVTTIEDYAFYDCNDLEEVNIPESVTNIGEYAFSLCNNLREIKIPNQVKYIDNGVFRGCESLTSVSTGAISGIGVEAFRYCKSLREMQIPNSVTRIDYRAFFNCESLEKITLPNQLKVIEEETFDGCGKLESITIPSTVKKIKENAFLGCHSLKEIIVEEENLEYKTIDGDLYDIEGKTLIRYAAGKESEEYITPKGVENIGKYALANTRKLKKVVISDGVCEIEEFALLNSSIESVIIPTSVYLMETGAFSKCSWLNKTIYLGSVDEWARINFESPSSNPITFSKNLYIDEEILTQLKITNQSNVSNYAFNNCDSLVSVELTECVDYVGKSAFSYCDLLTNVKMAENVESIGDYAFAYCKELETIKIPYSVIYVGRQAFEDCKKLTIYCAAGAIPNSWHTLWNETACPVYWGAKI